MRCPMCELPPEENSRAVWMAKVSRMDGRRTRTNGHRIGVVMEPAASGDQLRHCSRCDLWKPVEDFPHKDRRRGTRRSYCRDCCLIYGREHYRLNRSAYLKKARKRRMRYRNACQLFAYDYLMAHPCVDCGEANPVVLDFDHKDPATKTREVAWFVRRQDLVGLAAEIAKCEVRCANDHRRKTARDLGYARWLAKDE